MIRNDKAEATGLVDAPRLAEMLFDIERKKAEKLVRELARRRRIPYLKVGARLLFSPAKVREKLQRYEVPAEI